MDVLASMYVRAVVGGRRDVRVAVVGWLVPVCVVIDGVVEVVEVRDEEMRLGIGNGDEKTLEVCVS